jgi:hypothetical protein
VRPENNAVLGRLPKFLGSVLEFTGGRNFGSLKSANIVNFIKKLFLRRRL